MKPKELRDLAVQIFGKEWGWQTRLAEALGVDGSTVRRWASGAVPVPAIAQVAVRGLLDSQRLEHILKAAAPYTSLGWCGWLVKLEGKDITPDRSAIDASRQAGGGVATLSSRS